MAEALEASVAPLKRRNVRTARRHTKREKEVVMPKMKSKRGAAKRFKVRGSGSIKRAGAYKRHILTKKTTKRKRQMRRRTGVHHTNTAAIRSMLPYSS
jgi:large subunit ribosomal protein L35